MEVREREEVAGAVREEVRASAPPIARAAWVPTQNGQSRADTMRCSGAVGGAR